MYGIMLIFINLFFTPFTGLSLYIKRTNLKVEFSFKTISLYINFITWNIPITKLLTIISKKAGLQIFPESCSYTILSLISSLLLYGLAVIFTEFIHIHFNVNKKNYEQ